ncbi:hypothetical protein ACHAWF_007993, partial [Thalassiosira exigua]
MPINDKMDYVQLMFTLSPFPSYLPQYYTMMGKLAPSNVTLNEAADENDVPVEPQTTTVRDRDSHLRKRNLHDSPGSLPNTIDGSPPNNGFIPGSHSKPFEPNSRKNCASDGKDSNTPDAALSRATVLLLLSAHLLRLLYFHDLFLERERLEMYPNDSSLVIDGLSAPTAASGVVVDGIRGSTEVSNLSPPTESLALQWDLIGQSVSMIEVVQLMLLHAMMLLRRKHATKQRKRLSDGLVRESTDSLVESSALIESPANDPCSSSTQSRKLGNSPVLGNRRVLQIRCCQAYDLGKAIAHTMAVHLRYIFSPHNILLKHSFLDMMELLFLSPMAVKLVFDFHFYPLHGMKVVSWLKHASIVLESCLALPQAIRNYRKGSTKGLSIVMVAGWVIGDAFKLFYFLFSIIHGGPSGNGVFVMGCLLAITLDSIV